MEVEIRIFHMCIVSRWLRFIKENQAFVDTHCVCLETTHSFMHMAPDVIFIDFSDLKKLIHWLFIVRTTSSRPGFLQTCNVIKVTEYLLGDGSLTWLQQQSNEHVMTDPSLFQFSNSCCNRQQPPAHWGSPVNVNTRLSVTLAAWSNVKCYSLLSLALFPHQQQMCLPVNQLSMLMWTSLEKKKEYIPGLNPIGVFLCWVCVFFPYMWGVLSAYFGFLPQLSGAVSVHGCLSHLSLCWPCARLVNCPGFALLPALKASGMGSSTHLWPWIKQSGNRKWIDEQMDEKWIN